MAVVDYLNVITSQHRDKPNFVSVVSAYLDKVQEVVDCSESFDEEFNLQKASGAQQDVLGKILNVSRTLQFGSSYGDGILNDEDFYLVLQGQVAKNNWDGTLQDLYNLWESLFPETPIMIIDYQDMTADIYLMQRLSDLQMELLENDLLIPKTLGVTIKYFEVDKPIFAYDIADPYIVGDIYAGYNFGYYVGEI